MTSKITINIPEKPKQYSLIIGNNNFSQILFYISQKQKVLVITDQIVKKIYLPEILKIFKKKQQKHHVIALTAGEKAKNIEQVKKIWQFLIKNHYERNDLIIALGGGVIGDIAGFAASTFLRGIKYIQIPTTLLAQVDASIGGKTGIDFAKGKNLVGTFYHPELVLINLDTLATLPKKQMLAGYAECLKHGLIADKKYWEYFAGKNPMVLTKKELYNLVLQSCKIKAKTVELDEKETKGMRQILNFGHTLGHALETSTDFKTYTHGEAVSIGMIGASLISHLSGFLSQSELKEIKQKLKQSALPTKPKTFNRKKVLKAIFLDKKVQEQQVRWVLLKKIGQAVSNFKVKKSIIEKMFSLMQGSETNEKK